MTTKSMKRFERRQQQVKHKTRERQLDSRRDRTDRKRGSR